MTQVTLVSSEEPDPNCKHKRQTTFTYRQGRIKEVETYCLDCSRTLSVSTTEVASASSLAGEQRNDGG